jgi:creatinine amidohydrolase
MVSETKSEVALSLSEATWREVEQLDRAHAVAILPLGAVEAHGPHLPLTTDGTIALAMAREGARILGERRIPVAILPGIDYTAAPFAKDFPGTISIRPETVSAMIVDIAEALADHGFGFLALANAHFDPAHLGAIQLAVATIVGAGRIELIFPDVTRRPWALRLGDEFLSGACHAGRYEGSIMLAARPETVRESIRLGLDANDSSLSTAIREGRSSFFEAGGPDAYFGDPAAATAEEGERTIRVLGSILAEAVVASRSRLDSEPGRP